MTNSVDMSISSVVPVNGKKAAFVHFSVQDKAAEFIVPECRAVSNTGFTDEEMKMLSDYVLREKADIMDMARKVDPLGKFMKERV